ncbi:TonB-dependent receptor plug domain-containing protein [Woodsholea maritima]|uniref:TonB-dependent receptor plug domain-containing protein n=1 Tax=Woodsholea maritima TaxID=240237 RepID=UPI00035CAB72|nr:TonB-dependent receptor [Woodsholea maritima]
MTRTMFLLGAALGALSTPVFAAQTNTTHEDVITVEGLRIAQTLSEVGSSVSVITAEDLEQLGFSFAVDALAHAPGVTINQNGGFGASASVRIRGAASEQTLVLIDGIPVNDPTAPGGGYNFARVDSANIERIEVLRGPQSTLWGSDAIGGVVSITTKKPDNGQQISLFGEYGSYNTVRAGASVGGGYERGDFRLAAIRMDSDGISKADENNGNTEKDGYEATTLSAQAGLNFDHDIRLDWVASYTDASAAFDSYSATAQGSVADGDEVSDVKELSTNVKLVVPTFDGRLTHTLQVGLSDIERENLTNGAQSFFAEGQRETYRYQGAFSFNDQNAIVFGAEREETQSGGDKTQIDSLFGLYEWQPLEGLTLTGGLRLDDHDDFGSETTGRVAVAYNPTAQWTLRASWGEGFKAPTLFQKTYVCCGASVPNPNLAPETSQAFDVGVEWRTKDDRAEIGLVYFDQDTENLINFSFAVGGYENIAKASSQGVELYGRYQLSPAWALQASYSYIKAEDGEGKALIRVPEHSGDITLSYDPEGPFQGALLVRYNGEETDRSATLDGWTRVDLTGSYEVNANWDVYGRIENLFDEHYQQILGYGTPDRSGTIGLRARF